MSLDPAIKLQRAEERACQCGAAGSGEGHTEECPAEKFDRIPRGMTAAAALEYLATNTRNGIENANYWPRPWRAEVHHGMNRSTIYDANDDKIISGMNNEKAAFIAACVNTALPA